MTIRDEIIEKAGRLIYQKGYLATSISDIMTEAGVGKGQLYHYFPSKKAIGLEVLEGLLATWRVELFDGIFSADIEDKQKISLMLDWFYQFHAPQATFHGCPVGNLIVELSAQDEAFRQPIQDFMEQWRVELSDILKQGYPRWSQDEADLEAATILANLQGSAVLLKASQDRKLFEQLVSNLKIRYGG